MTSEKPNQAETMRKYRDGVATRLDRIERGVASLSETMSLLLALNASARLSSATRETGDATDR